MSTPQFETARSVMEASPFVMDLGLVLTHLEPGVAESSLQIGKRHMQFSGFVHAGVLASIADQTAGAAASTLLADGDLPLTVEFKINLLRPAVGEYLRCRSTILKSGRRFTVVESEVHAAQGDQSKLVAKGIFTIAIVGESSGEA